MQTFKKGDACYIVGHRTKYNSEIKSAGAKFITTTCGVKFAIDGERIYGEFGYSLYETESEYAEYLEKCKKVLQIKERVCNQLSLEQATFILNYISLNS